MLRKRRIPLGAIESERTAGGMIDLGIPMVRHLETRKRTHQLQAEDEQGGTDEVQG